MVTPVQPCKILLLADIHGNYPALTAVGRHFAGESFAHIIHCGDALVYAPFANETINWLAAQGAITILGNTDRKVKKLLTGKSFNKPRQADKRLMYSSTADSLSAANRAILLSWRKSARLQLPPGGGGQVGITIGIFHGSPTDPEEFLFADTPAERFRHLAASADCDIVVTGHSHSPYHLIHRGVHFVNPGSVGRMFDGDPRASCAILTISGTAISVALYRIAYDIAATVAALQLAGLPAIYGQMFKSGRKLN